MTEWGYSQVVVVREHGGMPFQQILWSRNGTLANIATGGMLTLKRSGKSRHTR